MGDEASGQEPKGVAVVPLWAVTRCGANASALRVLVALCGYRNGKGEAYPAVGTLATRTGLDRRTVQRTLRWLVGNSVIRAAITGTSRTTVYVIPTLAMAREGRQSCDAHDESMMGRQPEPQGGGVAVPPELNTELPKGKTLTATTPESARAVAVQDSFMNRGEVADRPMVTQRRNHHQTGARGRGGLEPASAVVGSIMDRLERQHRGAA